MEHDSPCNRRARRLNCKISRLKIVCYDDGDHSSATEQPAEIARRKSTLQRVLTVEEILNRHAATWLFFLSYSVFLSLCPSSLFLFLCRRMPNDRFENFGFRVREKAPPHCTAPHRCCCCCCSILGRPQKCHASARGRVMPRVRRRRACLVMMYCVFHFSHTLDGALVCLMRRLYRNLYGICY